VALGIAGNYRRESYKNWVAGVLTVRWEKVGHVASESSESDYRHKKKAAGFGCLPVN